MIFCQHVFHNNYIFLCTNVSRRVLILLCLDSMFNSLQKQIYYKSIITVGSYLLMDSFDSIPGASAQLWSPSIPAPSSDCLQLNFHYYMYGTAADMELTVHVVVNGKHLL